MAVTKTYPPEIEQIRQLLLEAIGEIRSRYEERLSPKISATAVAVAAMDYPKTPEQLANLQRDYQRDIDPIVRRLADLEDFATLTVVVPA